MPQIHYEIATHELQLDCGHTIKEGQTFYRISFLVCEADRNWPTENGYRLPLACFLEKQRAQK